MLTEEQKAEKKRIYQYYKEHGICVICHSRDAFPGRVRCEVCLEKNSAYSVKYYERNKQKLIKGYAERRARLRAQGLCTICGKSVSAENKYFCTEHRLLHNRKLRQRWRDLMNSDKAKDYYYKNGQWHKRLTPEEKLAMQRKNIEAARQSPKFKRALEFKRLTMYRGVYHGELWRPREEKNEI